MLKLLREFINQTGFAVCMRTAITRHTYNLLYNLLISVTLENFRGCPPTSSYSLYGVRSAWTMSPAHPSVKCFFSKTWNNGSTCGRIFEAGFAWKSCGFGDFGIRSGREEIIENCCERNIRGLSSVGKIYQARSLCLNMTQHCPSKADFTAPKERQQWNRSCPSAKMMALKSGMTLTYRIVHDRHTTIKFPPIFWDLLQSSTWPRA